MHKIITTATMYDRYFKNNSSKNKLRLWIKHQLTSHQLWNQRSIIMA